MAFDAGAIEATLTLNRNPFTAGLAAAKSQAASFARDKIEKEVTFKIDTRKLMEIEAQLKRISRQRVQATARVLVDRLQFDRLLRDLRQFDKSVYSTRVDVDTGRATANVIAFRTLLSTLNDQTVNLSANTRTFGRAAGDGFGQGASHFQRMATAIIVTLPVIASLFTATVGAVGALASTLIIAGLGAGAFALVAVPVFKQVKDAVAAGQAEINKLPDGLRQAANGLKELQTAYDNVIKANQKLVAIALSAWFNAGTAALKTLNPLIQASAEAFGQAGLMAISFFSSPWWQQFVDFLSGSIGPAVDMLFRSIFAVIRIIGNLTEAFWNLGGSQIMEMIASGLEKFALWTERIGQNKTFQAFMDSAVRSLPVVGALIGNLLEFIIKLAIGLEPLGTLIIRIFNGILEAINSVPLPVIQGVALGIAAVWAAMALGATGPVGIAVGVLAGLAAIFIYLATTSDQFQASIDRMMAKLRADFIPVWDTIVNNFNTKIKPAWDSLVDTVQNRLIPALQRFGETIYKEVMPKIQPFVDMLTGQVIPAVLGFLETIAKVVSFLVDVFGPTVARELGAAVTVFQGAFQTIAGLLNVFTGVFTGDWNKFTQGIRQITEGFWTIVAGMFGTNLDGLRTKFQEWDTWLQNTWNTFWNTIMGFLRSTWATITDIFKGALALLKGDVDEAATYLGRAWARVANFFREPINWVIRTVIGPPGGLAGAWNTVMGWIGQPQLSVSAPPQIPAFGGAFSQGGVLPGYAPRQDSLWAKVSPGEAVMVPEWTKAVGGPDAVRRMNQQAMSGKLYYEGTPRGYSLGGVVPHFAYGGVKPHVAAAGDEITRVFGRMPGGIGGVGARANASDHPSGFALDFMTMGNRGLGNRVAGYLTANWQRMAVKYLIWLQRIASRPGDWRPMADRGSPTANHMDHVHASFLGGPGGGGAPVPMVSWWSLIAGKVTSFIKGLFGGSIPGVGGPIGQAMSRIPTALLDKTIDALQKKLEGLMTMAGSVINAVTQGAAANPLSGMGTTDLGGWLPPGDNIVRNATGKMEPLTNLDVYERMKPAGLTVEDVLSLINSHGGSGSGGDTYNVMLPERATVRELADTIDFKRKVVSKGRYSR